MKFIRTRFPRKSNTLGSGVYKIRFAKACVISFCEFWGFLPCFYDPIRNKVIYRWSIRWTLIVCLSTILKLATIILFLQKTLRRGQIEVEVTHEVVTRLFMLKLNLFTGFAHLHTAWKAEEMYGVSNCMSAGFGQIANAVEHTVTKKTGTLMLVFYAMLAILSVSTVHPFVLDCSFHFMEELVGACRTDRSLTSLRFALEVFTQFLGGADLCGSILPYGIIMTEFILMPRELLTTKLRVLKQLKTGSHDVLSLFKTYDTLAVIFSHYNQVFRIFMPALINFLITSVSYTLACMVLRSAIILVARITISIYLVMILIRIIMIMDQSSKITKDSTQFLLNMKSKIPRNNKWAHRRLTSLKPLEVRVGEFHSVSTYVMFITLHAVISYTVSILLTTKEMLR